MSIYKKILILFNTYTCQPGYEDWYCCDIVQSAGDIAHNDIVCHSSCVCSIQSCRSFLQAVPVYLPEGSTHLAVSPLLECCLLWCHYDGEGKATTSQEVGCHMIAVVWWSNDLSSTMKVIRSRAHHRWMPLFGTDLRFGYSKIWS